MPRLGAVVWLAAGGKVSLCKAPASEAKAEEKGSAADVETEELKLAIRAVRFSEVLIRVRGQESIDQL